MKGIRVIVMLYSLHDRAVVPNRKVHLTLMLLVANLANRKWCKNMKNDWNPGIWVLIWKYSARAFQWIPSWHSLDVFQKSLHPCALDKTSLSIGRAYSLNHTGQNSHKHPQSFREFIPIEHPTGMSYLYNEALDYWESFVWSESQGIGSEIHSKELE